MGTDQSNKFEQIHKLHERLSNATADYWVAYSNLNTWQFWLLLFLIILPLVALYFLIDRKKVFLIGFFGFNIHVWFHYADAITATNGFIDYPYKVIPFLSSSTALDIALIPVTSMLLYQWIVNNKKNFYLYATAYSFIASFLFKPALVTFGLMKLYNGMNFFYIFLIYILIFVISNLITNFFMYLQRKNDYPLENMKMSRLLSIKKKAR
ncbi:CBO0543 family protein [Paenibacillus sp. WC2504]|uniref:CBO0543 family protein n=1 Tax=Paenibacillus sp. WC2504 TaxID=3461403 RepID=UPI0040462068